MIVTFLLLNVVDGTNSNPPFCPVLSLPLCYGSKQTESNLQGGPKRLRFVDCSQRNGAAKVIRHIMHSDAEIPGSPVFASSPFSGCLQLILKQSLSPRCNKQPHTQKKEQGQVKDSRREKPSSRKVTVNVSSEQEKRLAICCQSSSKFTA